MDCMEIRDFLFDYLTGRIGPSLQEEIENHIKTCPGCQKEAEELREVLGLLGSVRPMEPSPDFVQRVMERIEQRESSPFKGIVKAISDQFKKLGAIAIRPVPALAMVAMLFLVVLVSHNLFKPTDMGTMREMKIKMAQPIVITTAESRAGYPELKAMVEAYGGKILEKKETSKGVSIKVRIPQEAESAFIESLKILGKTKIERPYKNSKGEITIRLIYPEGTFSPVASSKEKKEGR